VVIICHIPFVFFAGKEGMLIIATEYQYRTISDALQDSILLKRNQQVGEICGPTNEVCLKSE
jgi:hypothetical protein